MRDKIKLFYKRYIKSEEKGIVKVWDIFTKLLSYISILELIIQYNKRKAKYYEINYEPYIMPTQERRNILNKKMDWLYEFIEWWVVGNCLLSIVLSIVVFYFFTEKSTVLIYIIIIYGLLRVFEIIIKQIRVILFDTLGAKAVTIKSARRSIILLIHNVVEMIFWFATSFMGIILINKDIVDESFNTLSEVYRWTDFISCSTLQMTVFSDGYTSLSALSSKQVILSTISILEIVIGFIIVVVSMARFFSLLPNVKQLEDKE